MQMFIRTNFLYLLQNNTKQKLFGFQKHKAYIVMNSFTVNG